MSDSWWPHGLYSPWDSLDPKDCTPPGSSVHGILQARILEWVPPGIFPSPCLSCVAGRFFTNWATREACFISKLLESKQTPLRSQNAFLKRKNDCVSLLSQTFQTTRVQNKIRTSFTTVSEALSCSQSAVDSQAERRKDVHCWMILQLLCIWFINTLCGIWTEKFKAEFGLHNLKCKQV